jgi:hypothetical protein
VALDLAQNMAEVLRVWSVERLDVPQPEALARRLQKVHELVNFEKADARLRHFAQISLDEPDKRCAPRRHPQRVLTLRSTCLRCVGAGLIEKYVDIGNRGERIRDDATHDGPVKAPEATP